MNSAIASLMAANVTFVGSHFVLSHPLRAALWRTLGERGFMALYTLVAFAALGWIVLAFRALGPGGSLLWNGQVPVPWALASLLTLLAAVLFLGSFKGNPAVPGAPSALARARPAGVFGVTRHPMMWSFALWALAYPRQPERAHHHHRRRHGLSRAGGRKDAGSQEGSADGRSVARMAGTYGLLAALVAPCRHFADAVAGSARPMAGGNVGAYPRRLHPGWPLALDRPRIAQSV